MKMSFQQTGRFDIKAIQLGDKTYLAGVQHGNVMNLTGLVLRQGNLFSGIQPADPSKGELYCALNGGKEHYVYRRLTGPEASQAMASLRR